MSALIFEVFDAADLLGTSICTLTEAVDKGIKIDRQGVGSGTFRIPKDSGQALPDVLKEGNYVKVTIRDVTNGPHFGFFLEVGDFALVSSDEQGGEFLQFGGRGSLSYTERAILWSESYIPGGTGPGPGGLAKLYLAGTGHKPGQILNRLIVESQHASRPQQPIPDLTRVFDYTNDSSATAWTDTDATDEIVGYVGDPILSVIGKLMASGVIDITMSADLVLGAWNSYGRDLSGAFASDNVRWQKGVNIVGELRRQMNQSRIGTHEVVQGATDVYRRVVLPTAGDYDFVRETFLKVDGSAPTTLDALGAADLQQRLLRSDAVALAVAVGNAPTQGLYLPGPPGSTGHYWIGDTVTLHTGLDPRDFTEQAIRIASITLSESQADDLMASVELGTGLGIEGFGSNAPASPNGVVTGGGVGGSGGGSGGSSGGSSGGTPTGPAAGDLSGSFPGPTVERSRRLEKVLTNKSGGTLVAGDVVIVDAANDEAVTTTTGAQSTKVVGIVQESIAADATGRVLLAGLADLVNVTASVTRSHYLETSTTVKQATANSARRLGSFGVVLVGGTTPSAWLWGVPDGADAALALDDLTDVDTTGKSDGDVLTWDLGAGLWGAATLPLATGEIIMQSGTSSPPVPIWNSAGDDWVYATT